MSKAKLIEESEFLAEIEATARRLGIKPTTLCLNAVSNGRLPARLAKGHTVTLDTIRRVRDYAAAELRKPRPRR